ncbi:hypothetical protein MRB53_027629 [Persea americana]|uniref:Uncharacterized protein n=1 Tax=Persea americana TaxID=3435 RepID=A0ACC2LM53_PERAE|nr:hypothetical protein MRB53_027629 [Persea americana]
MSFKASNLQLRSSKDVMKLQRSYVGIMKGTVRKTSTMENKSRDYRTFVGASSRKSFPLSYFRIESFLMSEILHQIMHKQVAILLP